MSVAAKDRVAGPELLVEHCFALGLRPPRPPARHRLEVLLGSDLAVRLVRALARAG